MFLTFTQFSYFILWSLHA